MDVRTIRFLHRMRRAWRARAKRFCLLADHLSIPRMSPYEPLPARTCSTCVNWYASNATPDDGVVKALCCVLRERKAGGEKCSAWKRVGAARS